MSGQTNMDHKAHIDAKGPSFVQPFSPFSTTPSIFPLSQEEML